MASADEHLRSDGTLRRILFETFGHPRFRAHQEPVCRALVTGQSVLLVMPTGAGKSICYQVPGLALGGTTLVISPLIALMEDQVASLRARGLSAAALHTGTPKAEIRVIANAWSGGSLQFLFVAPERLGQPKFVQFLNRHKPTLIAIDEAHCISQWGHDFRPDYRLLKKRLPALMPTPVIAMTATATARVRDDIAAQLGVDLKRFTHGFRRTNLAIEAREIGGEARSSLAVDLLQDSALRPAIVYAPTRKETESLAAELGESARAYHAGMPPDERRAAQRSFLDGTVDIIVATVAFGMGIDKADVRSVIHTALPSSVEGYYQEIGRAGRDGKPARAILLHHPNDHETQRWLFERSYPEPQTVERVYRLLDEFDGTRAALINRSGLEAAAFEKCLEKIVIFGGSGTLERNAPQTRNPNWLQDYAEQRRHRQEQLLEVTRFASTRRCRMLHLVQHFGDETDSGSVCGVCDRCRPTAVVSSGQPSIGPEEARTMLTVLDALKRRDRQSTGRLFRDTLQGALPRPRFEALLGRLAQMEYLELEEDEFEKDGKCIRYRRACLTPIGRNANLAELAGTRDASRSREAR